MPKTVIDGIPVENYGTKYTSEEEGSGYAWMLFCADKAPEDDDELIERIGFIRRYRGPGMPYTGEGHVRRVGRRVLAVQRFGWDI